jgi:phosphate transport system substrate-binding protein
MSQRNETPALIGALLVTAALLAGGYLWYSKQSGGKSLLPVAGNNSSGGTAADFASVKSVPSGQYNYGGSTSFAPIRGSVDNAIQTAKPEFRLQYANPTSGSASSGSGIQMLLKGEIDFAQMSRSLTDDDRAKAQTTLQEVAVAIDGLAVAVNPTLNLPGLTLDQLKSIYSQQVSNWSQVGGPNLPIVPISRPKGSGGTVELFQAVVMGGQPFGSNVKFVNTTTDALRQLSITPGGLYYASAPEIVPQCTTKPLPIGRNAGKFVPPYAGNLVAQTACPTARNQLNRQAFRSGDYPLTRQLFVTFKQDGGRSQQAGQAYADLLLSDRGQMLLEEAGFVKLR